MTEIFSKKKIAILGSTGSIGIQTLEIARTFSDKISVEVLTSNNNSKLLIQQALEFNPNTVVISNETHYPEVKHALRNTDIKVFTGEKSVVDVAANSEIDTLVLALVGFAGLKPALNAINNGINIALATKEVLVVAGELITKEARKNNCSILPIDSEHSALLQCVVGEQIKNIEKLYLTASGGPFRTFTANQLEDVSINQALSHPNWSMGKKISIDSATLMNKGFEVIEAAHLFNFDINNIDVVVHPQSIIHSFVKFVDGSIKSQLGQPDMKLPILYALSFPDRWTYYTNHKDIFDFENLTFEKPKHSLFPCLNLAYEAFKHSGTSPCVLNAANEIAVDAFLQGKIKFTQISKTIEYCLNNKELYVKDPTIDDYIFVNQKTRNFAETVISNFSKL